MHSTVFVAHKALGRLDLVKAENVALNHNKDIQQTQEGDKIEDCFNLLF